MPSDDTKNAGGAAAASAAETEKGKPNRKRRISKRERKNLKKQKKLGGSGLGPGEPNVAATLSTGNVSATTDNSNCLTGVKKKHLDSANPSLNDEQDTSRRSQKTEPSLDEYMTNYTPAPSIKVAKEDDNDSKSLGKWFPKASVIKSAVCYSNDYLAKLAKEKKKAEKNKSSTEKKVDAPVEPKASLVLFYQYVSPTWSQAKVSSFLTYLTTIAKKHRTNIGGRIRVSTEGVNATVSAASTSDSGLDPAFEAAQTLRHFAEDLRQFDSVSFADTDFKYIDGLSADRHFKELKLLPVKELVFYGIREDDCAVEGAGGKEGDGGNSSNGKEVKGGIHLDAKDYHEMLKRKDAVVIDVRNHYEAAIGRFDGQMENVATGEATTKCSAKDDDTNGKKDGEADPKSGSSTVGEGGAEYIDPKMRKSTDFTSWLAEPETKQKLEGKTVMMFCTGGIRCERASAYLNSQMGSEVKGVYQLQGGIERYLQAFPEGGFWRGKNFVFDKREAIGAGNINGDGGVVRKDNAASASEKPSGNKDGAQKKAKEDDKLLPWGTECAKCQKPWDRYIGKRKCYTCGVPVLVCDTCLSQSSSANSKKKKKKKKKSTETAKADGKHGPQIDSKADDTREDGKSTEEDRRIRCPLCIEEGVTVPAEDVDFTDNGIRGRLRSSSFSEGGGDGAEGLESAPQNKKKDNKAAKSVLKWGGGHATKKKEKRKFARRPCQFGAECVRKDCFFYHPEREKNRKSVK